MPGDVTTAAFYVGHHSTGVDMYGQPLCNRDTRGIGERFVGMEDWAMQEEKRTTEGHVLLAGQQSQIELNAKQRRQALHHEGDGLSFESDYSRHTHNNPDAAVTRSHHDYWDVQAAPYRGPEGLRSKRQADFGEGMGEFMDKWYGQSDIDPKADHSRFLSEFDHSFAAAQRFRARGAKVISVDERGNVSTLRESKEPQSALSEMGMGTFNAKPRADINSRLEEESHKYPELEFFQQQHTPEPHDGRRRDPGPEYNQRARQKPTSPF